MLIQPVRHERARVALPTVVRLLSALVSGAVVAMVAGAVGAEAMAVGADVSYVPPVDGPVIDGFRPPETPYGPGNRGLKYAVRPGEPAHASADGTVTFAGQVGGSLHVTVSHADGVRTSYSFLASVGVGRGQRVHQGDPVGTTGPVLHFGARRGDAYIDPASLFGGRGGHVELVPFEVPPGAAVDEVESLRQIALSNAVLDGEGVEEADGDSSGDDVARWLRRSAATEAEDRRPRPASPRPLVADSLLDVVSDLAARLRGVAGLAVFVPGR